MRSVEAPAAAVSIPAPRDPALPALGVALNAGAMRELLQDRLPEVELESCRPCYVRYKPATNALVKYELEARGESETLVAHLRLFADGRATEILERKSRRRLAGRAAAVGDARVPSAVYLSELPAAVQFFPLDIALPALVEAASPRSIEQAFRDASLSAPLADESAELIRYKPARKALLRFACDAGGRHLYVKLHADTRGARHLLFGPVLERAGMPGAAPLVYHAGLRMLVHAEQVGTSLRALRSSPAFASWMEPLGELLARLHSTRPPGVPARSPAFEAGRVIAASGSLATLLPAHAAELFALGARLARHLEEATAPPTAVHGDFWDDQVLVSGRGAVLLDFDELRLGDPFSDVANFLAQLAARKGERVHDADGVRAAFLDAYASHRPDGNGTLVLHEAAALLRAGLGSFRRLEPDWPHSAERLVGLARDRLRDYERAPRGRRPLARPSGAAPRDAMLPQLAALFDPSIMAELLEREVVGSPVTVHDASVVRHKPGRRCTIRYELGIRVNGREQPLRLYGKTFASERGPQVHELLSDVAEARPFGLQVGVPQPVAYLAPLKLSLCSAVEGEPIASWLVAGDDKLAARIAEALHRFHSSGVDLGRRHSLNAELEPLAARVGEIHPDLRGEARECLERIEARAEHTERWRRRPAHRDFYYDQVLVDGSRLSILDLDDAAIADPSLDVANFMGHLRLLALQRPEGGAVLATAERVFVARYRELDKRLGPVLVELLTGATLLRLAHIHGSRPGGYGMAAALLTECVRHLDGTSES